MRLSYNPSMKFRPFFLAAALMATPLSGYAQLSIEITGAGANRIPVAIADFGGERIIAQALTSVVRADLERSGLFRLVDPNGLAAGDGAVPFADWKSRGADALVGGAVTASGTDRYETRFRLHDVQKQTQLGGQAYGHAGGQIRVTAHRVSVTSFWKIGSMLRANAICTGKGHFLSRKSCAGLSSCWMCWTTCTRTSRPSFTATSNRKI